jgi:hypothetical protein
MAKQVITGGNGASGQTGSQVKGIINDNFTELYDAEALNTAKVGITPEQAAIIADTSGTNTGDAPLTSGSGTTANGTAVDLGGALREDVDILGDNTYGVSLGTTESKLTALNVKTSTFDLTATQGTSNGYFYTDGAETSALQGDNAIGFSQFQLSTQSLFLTTRNPSNSVSTSLQFTKDNVTLVLGSDQTGDIYYRNASGHFTRRPIGAESQVLIVSSGVPAWSTPTATPAQLTEILARTLITDVTDTLAITFNSQKWYYTDATPATGNITDDLTGALKGIIQKIYHNDATEPTVPAGWVLIGGSYQTSVLNIIMAEWISGTRVEYWIIQES